MKWLSPEPKLANVLAAGDWLSICSRDQSLGLPECERPSVTSRWLRMTAGSRIGPQKCGQILFGLACFPAQPTTSAVIPVLVTGTHISANESVGGTMGAGNKCRHDIFGFGKCQTLQPAPNSRLPSDPMPPKGSGIYGSPIGDFKRWPLRIEPWSQ